MKQKRGKHGTTRQKVFEFIRDWQKEYGYSPSFREIGEGVGITSLSSISFHLNRLEIEGRIFRPIGKTRAIVIKEVLLSGEYREG